MVICLERGADLRMAQLMPLPLTVYCFSKIHIGFTFLVPAHSGSPGQRTVKWLYYSSDRHTDTLIVPSLILGLCSSIEIKYLALSVMSMVLTWHF